MNPPEINSFASDSNPIRMKIDGLVNKKLHADPAFQAMLDELPLPDEFTVDKHFERRLRRNLQQQMIDADIEYTEEISKINDMCQNFAAKVREMHNVCSGLTTRIQVNKQKTQDLLSKTSEIQNRKKFLEAKEHAIDEFLDKYSLTEKEEQSLQGNMNDGIVGSEFFSALKRVKDIHEQSKTLLCSGGEHSAAVEIMVEMNAKMEKAFEVLYRSIQRECRLMNSDYVELKSVVANSFAALQDRELLFKYSLDEFSNARKNQILRLYIDALTKGSGGSAKPIELLSHDPLRYIGDMLAWIYQCVESERDLLMRLLGQCRPEVVSACSLDVIGQISSALCRPFKVRVEQSLAGETDPVAVYRLSALFAFYSAKLNPLVGQDSELCTTVRELNELALNIFYAGLNSNVQRILGKMGAPDYDLLPVPAVHQLLNLLKDVLETHDGAMASCENPKQQFNQIFVCVLDPLHRAIQLAATQLASPLDVAVYTLNCLNSIQSLVILYQFADDRLEMLKALIEGNEDVLVSEEASSIMANTALIAIYQKAASHTASQGPMSALPGLDVATVKKALASFDTYLSHPDEFRMDQVARINSARIRESISVRTAQNVLAAYSMVASKLSDPANGYGDIQFKTPEQIKDLIGA